MSFKFSKQIQIFLWTVYCRTYSFFFNMSLRKTFFTFHIMSYAYCCWIFKDREPWRYAVCKNLTFFSRFWYFIVNSRHLATNFSKGNHLHKNSGDRSHFATLNSTELFFGQLTHYNSYITFKQVLSVLYYNSISVIC